MHSTNRRLSIAVLGAAVFCSCSAWARPVTPIEDIGFENSQIAPAPIEEQPLVVTDANLEHTPGPVLATFGRKSQGWILNVEAPVVWTDSDGNAHEIEQLDSTWRKWLRTLGPKLLKQWEQNPAFDANSVSGTVSLRTPKQVGGLQFTPESEQENTEIQFSNFVRTVTGLSQGKQLGDIMPRAASTATALYLNLKFERQIDR